MARGQRTIRIRFDGTVAALRRATAAGREQMQRFRRTATDANEAIASSTSKVDRQIEEVERSLKDLSREFEETGDVELFKKIRKDRSLLRQLRQIREELDDVGDEAGEAGRKVGKAFSGQFLGRVGSALPGAISGVFNALPPKVQGAVVIAALGLAASFATAFGAAVVAAVLLALGGGVLTAGIIGAFKTDRFTKQLDKARGKIEETKSTLQDLQRQYAETGDEDLLPRIAAEKKKLQKLREELKGVKKDVKDVAVTEAFRGVGDQAKKSFRGFLDAFREPLVRAAGTVKGLLKDLGPTFTRIGEDMAPLIDDLVPAFADLVKNSMPGFERALKASKPLFETLADHAPEIGKAFSKFFDLMAAGSPGATKFLDHLLTAVEALLPAIGLFFQQLSVGYLTTVEVFKDIGRVVYGLTIVILEAIQAVVDIAAQIPGPHQDAMKKVSNAVGGAINKVKGLKSALDDVPSGKTVNIRFTNRARFLAHIRQMRRELRSLTNQGVRVAGVTGRGGFSEFHTGGTVPGPVGQERLILAQGGETVRTPEQEASLHGGGDTTVQVFLDGELLEPVAVRVFDGKMRELKRRAVAGAGAMA